MNLQKRTLLSVFLISCGVSSLTGCQRDKGGVGKLTEAETKRLARMEEMVRGWDVPIDFYGRVVDQQDRPVPGAEVVLALKQFSPNPLQSFTTIKEIKTKTNDEGLFFLRRERGNRVHVLEIQKKGYEFSKQEYARIGSFEYSQVPEPFVPNPNAPVIYRVRKLGEGTFLLKQDMGFSFRLRPGETSAERGWDLVRGADASDPNNLTIYGNEPLACDLKGRVVYDAATSTWSLTLSAGTPGGGADPTNCSTKPPKRVTSPALPSLLGPSHPSKEGSTSTCEAARPSSIPA